MSTGDREKFDLARAHVLDAPEREAYVPTAKLVDAFELRGDERSSITALALDASLLPWLAG